MEATIKNKSEIAAELLRRYAYPYMNNTLLLQALNRWDRQECYFHGTYHLYYLFEYFNQEIVPNDKLSDMEKSAILFALVYHDLVYDPRNFGGTNESLSKKEWETDSHDKNPVFSLVSQMIEASVDHVTSWNDPNIPLAVREFLRLDLLSWSTSSLQDLIEQENLIFKEFQYVDYGKYREARVDVLTRLAPVLKEINSFSAIDRLIEYVHCRKIRIGIYAGSFFPFHKGHLDILKQAEQMFDKVIIAFGVNPDKAYDFAKNVYFETFKETILPFHQVEKFSGFLTDYVRSKTTKYCNVTLVKGLGRPGDLENEKTQLRYMEDMYSDIRSVYILSDRKYEYVSSSGIRNIDSFGKSAYDHAEVYRVKAWPFAYAKEESSK